MRKQGKMARFHIIGIAKPSAAMMATICMALKITGRNNRFAKRMMRITAECMEQPVLRMRIA